MHRNIFKISRMIISAVVLLRSGSILHDPLFSLADSGVHSWILMFSTTNPPAHNSYQSPPVIDESDQGSSTVTTAWVMARVTSAEMNTENRDDCHFSNVNITCLFCCWCRLHYTQSWTKLSHWQHAVMMVCQHWFPLLVFPILIHWLPRQNSQQHPGVNTLVSTEKINHSLACKV